MEIKKLSEIAYLLNGYAFKSAKYVERGIRIIRIANVQDGYIADEKPCYYPSNTDEDISKYMLAENDLLVSLTGNVGRVAMLTKGFLPAALNQRVSCIRIKDSKIVDKKYLYYFFRQKFFVQECIEASKGVAQLNLSTKWLENYTIPVPPLPEQERIVARIEELFSQLDDGVETLKKTKAQLAVYRQAVLKEAFEGRLTEEWRRSNGITKQCFVHLSREKRDTALAYRKMKPLKYEWKDDIILPSIPQEWEYAQIGDVAWSIKDGPHYSPEYSEEGVPFITGGNVRPTGVDFQSAKRISLELHEELCKRCCPEKGDMLYTKGGTTGIARVNTYNQEFSVWVHVAVIKFVDSVLPEYLQHVLNSPFCYQQSQKYTHGVGNQDLGLTRMINIIFPICSIEEQKQIVANLESRLSVCTSIEQTVDAALQQAEAMRQSILKQAFEGKLL